MLRYGCPEVFFWAWRKGGGGGTAFRPDPIEKKKEPPKPRKVSMEKKSAAGRNFASAERRDDI